MTQNLTTGNSILGMTNVALLTKVIKRLENRAHGLDGIGVFSGEPGLGKSIACAYAAASMDAIHISVQTMWTKKTLLEQILREVQVFPKKTLADMMMQVNQELALARRPLLIDEADRAVQRGMIEVIRDMYDGSSVPIVLIGMDQLPQNLRKWPQVDSRVLTWVQAEYADLGDAKMLAKMYAPGITISDQMIAVIRERNGAIPRRMVTDFALVLERCRELGLAEISLDQWGKSPLAQNKAPNPRNRAFIGEVDINA